MTDCNTRGETHHGSSGIKGMGLNMQWYNLYYLMRNNVKNINVVVDAIFFCFHICNSIIPNDLYMEFWVAPMNHLVLTLRA